eukprot:13170930-Ditylum_brightwellii.AAC.1
MTIFYKPISTNKHQEPQELIKGKEHLCKLCTFPYNAKLPIYNIAVHFYDTGTVEEWLKFGQTSRQSSQDRML